MDPHMKHTQSRLWSGRRRLAPENYDIYWDSVSWDQSLEPPTSTEVIIRGHFHPGTLQSPTERDLTSSLPVLTRQKVFSNLGTQRGFKLGLWHQKRPLKVFYWVCENCEISSLWQWQQICQEIKIVKYPSPLWWWEIASVVKLNS